MVDADAVVADHLQTGEPVEHRAVDRADDRRCTSPSTGSSLPDRGRLPGDDLDAIAEQALDRRVQRGVGHDAGESRVHFDVFLLLRPRRRSAG